MCKGGRSVRVFCKNKETNKNKQKRNRNKNKAKKSKCSNDPYSPYLRTFSQSPLLHNRPSWTAAPCCFTTEWLYMFYLPRNPVTLSEHQRSFKLELNFRVYSCLASYQVWNKLMMMLNTVFIKSCQQSSVPWVLLYKQNIAWASPNQVVATCWISSESMLKFER